MKTRPPRTITFPKKKKGPIRPKKEKWDDPGMEGKIPDRPEGGRDGEPDNAVPLWCLLNSLPQAASASPKAALIFICCALTSEFATPLSSLLLLRSNAQSGSRRTACSLRRLFRTALWNNTALRALGPDIAFFSSSITSSETRCAARNSPSDRFVNPCIATLRDDQGWADGMCRPSRRCECARSHRRF